MTDRRPIILRGPAANAHPALAAWNRRRGTRAALGAIEVWHESPAHQPASVYRLVFPDRDPPPIFAKRCDAASAGVERLCYEEVLPGIGVSSPRYFGSLGEADETRWFFLEDVGRRRLSANDPAHRALAGRWLGRLHRLGSLSEAAHRLPAGGAARYLEHLHSGRGRILHNFSNPALTDADRDLLSRVLAVQKQVEDCWDAIERACVGIPETLVHGDFRPKNVRVRQEAQGFVLYALDWELAGWGVPVADLAPARGSDVAFPMDLETYAAELGEAGAGLGHAAMDRLSALGYVFRRLAAVDWETTSLHFERPDFLSKPLASLKVLRRDLVRGLAHAEDCLA